MGTFGEGVAAFSTGYLSNVSVLPTLGGDHGVSPFGFRLIWPPVD